ncbi:hypothetical protein GGR52DRAFT_522738 [Hypoxylon sp. FL1284]|nr:hypothetical protein GGR52DRAFT_522738 [Hypoxylon sp. FL1284]
MASPSSLSLDSLIVEAQSPEQKQPWHKKAYRLISVHCSSAWREVLSDLRSAKWARVGLWELFVIWTVAIMGCFTFINFYTVSYWESSACTPDGSFHVDCDEGCYRARNHSNSANNSLWSQGP